MKKLISAILILVLLPLYALAEYDLSSMTDQQLIDLIARASAELSSRSASAPDIAPTAAPAATFEPAFDNSIDGYRFILVEKTMADYLGILNEYSATDVTPINDEYRIATHNDIRLIYRGSKIVKASYNFLNPMSNSDTDNSIYWGYCLLSVLESDVLNQRYISSKDKHDAFDKAHAMFEKILDSVELCHSFIPLIMEGNTFPVAIGKYNYDLEYMDDSFWISATFADLPEGIY